MNFSPYHSKSRERGQGTDKKVTKTDTSVGDTFKKKDVTRPKYIYIYISRTPKQNKNIHKAICASEIVILPSTKDNNSTTLPTWLIKTNMYDEYFQSVFWYHKYMQVEDNKL